MSKQSDVDAALRRIHHALDDVHDVVVATSDGLPVASTSPNGRTDKVAAMAASVLALSHQAVADPSSDAPSQTVIRGRDGCLIVQGAGASAVVAVHTGPKPNMGLVQVEVPTAATEIQTILG